jgi:hypothetical protein
MDDEFGLLADQHCELRSSNPVAEFALSLAQSDDCAKV